MTTSDLNLLCANVSRVESSWHFGRVASVREATLSVSGLSGQAVLGDKVEVSCRSGHQFLGEIISLDAQSVEVMPCDRADGVAIGDMARLKAGSDLSPHESWVGRVLDPDGQALDGRPVLSGETEKALQAKPPAAASRNGFGARLECGMSVFNTLIPIVRGQRIGLFAGSGVGKSTLLSRFATNIEADVVVIGLVGERGREVGHFVEKVLGPSGMERSVVIAATSDQSPLARRRCAWSAMTVAEFFRDQGKHVLLLLDSVTRFAEAHREIAIASGEPIGSDGYPASLAHQIMALAERAGPGAAGMGDMTAIFSVLVAASDMDGPVADTLRGVLDGHVVLDRAIAERGRFPAIDVLRSVSRSLPEAASPEENTLLDDARALFSTYAQGELMIQSGLYSAGSDPNMDRAIQVWPRLDRFVSGLGPETVEDSFKRLQSCLKTGETR